MNFSNYSSPDSDARLFLQEYQYSSQDQVLGSSSLRLDWRLNRTVDDNYNKPVNNHSLRANLMGQSYGLNILYTPRQYASPAGREAGSELEGMQALWDYRHDGWPGLRVEYRESKRHQAIFNATTFSSVSRMRLAEMDHRVGGLSFNGVYRVTNSSSSTSVAGDNTNRSGTLNAAFDGKIGKKVRFSLGADAQRSETGKTGFAQDVTQTRNLRGSGVWRPGGDLQLGLSTYYRESQNDRNQGGSTLDVNRGLTAKAIYKPTETVDFHLQRDVRTIRNQQTDSGYDVFRVQGVYAGLLRRGLRARITGMKHVTVLNRNSSTPADATDVTLNFNLYRQTSARTSLTYNRQQHRDADFESRHSVNKVLEIRSQLSRRLLGRLDYRGTQSSRKFSFFEVDAHNLQGNFSYTKPSGFSLSASYRKSILVTEQKKTQTFWGLNISGRLSERLTYNLDGNFNSNRTDTSDGDRAAFNARLQLRVGERALATASYQSSRREGIQVGESFNASFQTTF